MVDSFSRSLEDRLVARSFRPLRISSSRALVAAFRLTRSVALSLLRLLNWDISFCRDVAMRVKLSICAERDSEPRADDFSSCVGVSKEESFPVAAEGDGRSRGTCMFCNASIAEEGGVFSPSMGFDK